MYVRYKLNVVARFHTWLPYIHKYVCLCFYLRTYIQYVLIYSMCFLLNVAGGVGRSALTMQFMHDLLVNNTI